MGAGHDPATAVTQAARGAAPAPPAHAPAHDLPQARTRELLRTRLFLQAALPTVKVLLADDPATAKRFAGVNAPVQIVAKVRELLKREFEADEDWEDEH